ncbi:MAG: tRNA (guanosine(46)-N7)-methyltransferase TrmB [Floccifex porci]|uniref:tRNA (guanine-N(7)-)-methyltransferase n=2 Tax=Floccifex porci TaxID=2606629 RepID=A0A7X2N214_9FIRM|nr:tRNA (guanosine(46)-N7)-methyltransferase TrmB [Floccifex porci]MCI7801872.1 tRNA (guanosine(46)-N7)-methyltransferase TrmB [Erysipelotrichaceae bacterium]MDD7467293.1 tRNA (guanosine(46)-N7)-methyltransferase TrmB [Floccifex porci]MSS00593.1 tRNA (guanosine(46)-N7)-methyltransferase TrmB [Floccifex porci]
MRMRKVKWAVDYLTQSPHLVLEPQTLKGKWKDYLKVDSLHVEIGCGKGNYSLEMSNMYPDQGYVAIEKNESAAGMAVKKFDENEGNGHLALIQKDASDILSWFEIGEVDVIHLNFSDPWPKKRYAKRRLSSKSFLDQYKTILNKSGQIQMKTDNASLFEYSVLEFENNGFKMIEFSVDYRRETHNEDVLTEYEEKFVKKNQPIYRCVWEKI